MTKNSVIFALVLVFLGLEFPCMASVRVVIYPSDDAFVDSQNPGVNYGNDDNLYTRNGGGLEYRTYLKFNLSSIPHNRNIISARLALNCNMNYGGIVYVHYLENDNWNENSITWNNAPVNFQPVAAASLDPSIDYNYWTVTNDVINAHNTDDIYSAVVKMASGFPSIYNYFYSKDFEFSYVWPFLEVTCDGDRYGGGSGTAQDPYLIYTAEQLSWIGDNHDDWNKYFKLMADIDLSAYTGIQFHIISTDWQEPFVGSFDGNKHVISNLNFTPDPNSYFNYVGLFGCIGQGGVVKNLGLESPNIACGSNNGAGALTGDLSGGAIENCWVRNVQVSGDFRSGGLIGELSGGTVSGCWARNLQVSSRYTAAGLIGELNSGVVSDSFAEGGVVSSLNYYACGLVGGNYGSILRCYSTCFVSGRYSEGLVGYGDGIDTASFWDEEASGTPWSAGGWPKTTAQMKTQSTFANAGWDFSDIDGDPADWMMLREGEDYPRLIWQEIFEGDIAGLYGVDWIDLEELATYWLQSGCPTGCEEADIDESGTVDILDYSVLAADWLKGM